LDVFTDASFATQVIDFNPGVAGNGLFWTTAIPDDAVDAHPGAGTGRYALTDFAVPDYHNGFNSILGGQHDPGVASFDIRWDGNGESSVQTDGSSFSFDAVVSSATVEWEGTNSATGAHFVSDPRNTSHSAYAALGHLKNGVFFRS
jgi:hypothetical protein